MNIDQFLNNLDRVNYFFRIDRSYTFTNSHFYFKSILDNKFIDRYWPFLPRTYNLKLKEFKVFCSYSETFYLDSIKFFNCDSLANDSSYYLKYFNTIGSKKSTVASDFTKSKFWFPNKFTTSLVNVEFIPKTSRKVYKTYSLPYRELSYKPFYYESWKSKFEPYFNIFDLSVFDSTWNNFDLITIYSTYNALRYLSSSLYRLYNNYRKYYNCINSFMVSTKSKRFSNYFFGYLDHYNNNHTGVFFCSGKGKFFASRVKSLSGHIENSVLKDYFSLVDSVSISRVDFKLISPLFFSKSLKFSNFISLTFLKNLNLNIRSLYLLKNLAFNFNPKRYPTLINSRGNQLIIVFRTLSFYNFWLNYYIKFSYTYHFFISSFFYNKSTVTNFFSNFASTISALVLLKDLKFSYRYKFSSIEYFKSLVKISNLGQGIITPAYSKDNKNDLTLFKIPVINDKYFLHTFHSSYKADILFGKNTRYFDLNRHMLRRKYLRKLKPFGSIIRIFKAGRILRTWKNYLNDEQVNEYFSLIFKKFLELKRTLSLDRNSPKFAFFKKIHALEFYHVRPTNPTKLIFKKKKSKFPNPAVNRLELVFDGNTLNIHRSQDFGATIPYFYKKNYYKPNYRDKNSFRFEPIRYFDPDHFKLKYKFKFIKSRKLNKKEAIKVIAVRPNFHYRLKNYLKFLKVKTFYKIFIPLYLYRFEFLTNTDFFFYNFFKKKINDSFIFFISALVLNSRIVSDYLIKFSFLKFNYSTFSKFKLLHKLICLSFKFGKPFIFFTLKKGSYNLKRQPILLNKLFVNQFINFFDLYNLPIFKFSQTKLYKFLIKRRDSFKIVRFKNSNYYKFGNKKKIPYYKKNKKSFYKKFNNNKLPTTKYIIKKYLYKDQFLVHKRTIFLFFSSFSVKKNKSFLSLNSNYYNFLLGNFLLLSKLTSIPVFNYSSQFVLLQPFDFKNLFFLTSCLFPSEALKHYFLKTYTFKFSSIFRNILITYLNRFLLNSYKLFFNSSLGYLDSYFYNKNNYKIIFLSAYRFLKNLRYFYFYFGFSFDEIVYDYYLFLLCFSIVKFIKNKFNKK